MSTRLSARELKELERRLAGEPDNLGLRVTVAGHLREAGRVAEAVEHYRAVAVAYRDQGRTLQAVAVCKSLLAIAPDDHRCKALLGEIEAPKVAMKPPELPKQPPPRVPISAEPSPPRRAEVLLTRLSGPMDETPLPRALPYHVADPTSSAVRKISRSELEPSTSGEFPSSIEDHVTNPIALAEDSLLIPVARGSQVDVAEEMETRQRSRISTAEMRKISETEPNALVTPDPDADESMTRPMARLADPSTEDDVPALPALPPPRAESTEDELTEPGADERHPMILKKTAVDPFSTSFFSHFPVERRAAVLSRFHRRAIKAGETVIARGTNGHPFVLVLRGELEVRPERRPAFTVGPGEYAGESSLLARGSATSTVVAAIDSNVLLLLPGDFYEIVGAFPALWSELKDLASRRG